MTVDEMVEMFKSSRAYDLMPWSNGYTKELEKVFEQMLKEMEKQNDRRI